MIGSEAVSYRFDVRHPKRDAVHHEQAQQIQVLAGDGILLTVDSSARIRPYSGLSAVAWHPSDYAFT
jgi:hypothetical protein